MISLEEGDEIIFLPKDLKYYWHLGGRAINYDYDDGDDDGDEDDFDEDNDDFDVFSISQRTSNTISTRWGPINYYDDDDNDDEYDDDDDDNNDDDDDDDDVFLTHFLFRIIIVEAPQDTRKIVIRGVLYFLFHLLRVWGESMHAGSKAGPQSFIDSYTKHYLKRLNI